MPLRKLNNIGESPGFCRDPEHNPPSMMVYENGTYEYECPSCGHTVRFRVNKPTL